MRAIGVARTGAAFLLALLAGAVPSVADTNVSGTISTNTTWTLAGSPYIVTGFVTVAGASTPTLTVDAGVVVKFNSGQWLAIGNGASSPGRLVVNGTSSQPVKFTSNQATPTAGYYRGLGISVNGTSTQLSYLTIEAAGQNAWGTNSAVWILNSTTNTWDHVTFQTNAGNATAFQGGTTTITDSTITGTTTTGGEGNALDLFSGSSLTISNSGLTSNGGAAVSLRTGASLNGMTGMTVTGNGLNAVRYRSNTITANETWKSFGLAYHPDSYVAISAASVPTLTLEAGVVVKFPSLGTLSAGANGQPGRLVVSGTSAQPVKLTSTQATPTAGFWRGLGISVNGSSSQVSYLTVEAAGQNAYGMTSAAWIMNTTTNTWDHVTFQTNTGRGVSFEGGTTIVTDSTITGTAAGAGEGNAIDLFSGATVTISSSSLTNNAGAAVSLRSGAILNGMTGMTVTGNGYNLIRYRTQTIAANETWKNLGLAYQPDTFVAVAAASVPTLTIEAGVVVKFPSTTWLAGGNTLPGRLVVSGTAAQPVKFTSTQATPTAGAWRGLGLSVVGSSSQISYLTIEAAGQNAFGTNSAIWVVDPGAHLLDHVTFQTNAGADVAVSGGTPTFDRVTFASPVTSVKVSGPGDPLFVNCTFAGGTTAIDNQRTDKTPVRAPLNYWSAANGPNYGSGTGSGRTITGPALFEPWLSSSPNEAYLMTSATQAARRFNPSGGPYGSLSMGAAASGSWTFVVSDGSGPVRTQAATGATAAFTWDGKNDAGVLQPDGSYTFTIDATGPGSAVAATGKGKLIVDSTLSLAITAPAASELISNIYRNGATDYTVTGSVGMANLSSWRLDYGAGNPATSFTSISTGTSTVTNGTLGTWATAIVTNGLQTVRLLALDTQGTVLWKDVAVTVGNFFFSLPSVYQLNPTASQTVTYTSTVPFTLTETVVLKNAAGQTVRTLFNGSRSAGTFQDVWNGKSDASAFLPDGPYFSVATATAGASSLTVDLTNQFIGNFYDWRYPTFSAFDPYKNQPLTFSYTFGSPGRVSVAFMPPSASHELPNCQPYQPTSANYCPVYEEYTPSTSQTIRWAGVDHTGKFRSDLGQAAVAWSQEKFSKNAAVAYGTRPTLGTVTVTPALYGPLSGNQTVGVPLSSFQAQTMTLSVAFLNQQSLSTLRTITQNASVTTSTTTFNVVWDGRADNGARVAPGDYTITVTVTDPIGNVVKGQVLTTLLY